MSPFGQVESPFSRMHEGTGLGLPLTQRLVALIGGRMEISSEKGIGTLVKVTLPIEERTDAGTAGRRARDRPKRASASPSPDLAGRSGRPPDSRAR